MTTEILLASSISSSNGSSSSSALSALSDAQSHHRRHHMRSSMPPEEPMTLNACNVSRCACKTFVGNHRICQNCGHSWVLHAPGLTSSATSRPSQPPMITDPAAALAATFSAAMKSEPLLLLQGLLQQQQKQQQQLDVEPLTPAAAMEIASLALYGAKAVPVRLKLLLDRMFDAFHSPEYVDQLLGRLDWRSDDYARGYCLSSNSWPMATRDEEQLIMQQFLRFGETKVLAQTLLLQDVQDRQVQQQSLQNTLSNFRTARPSPVAAPTVSFDNNAPLALLASGKFYDAAEAASSTASSSAAAGPLDLVVTSKRSSTGMPLNRPTDYSSTPTNHGASVPFRSTNTPAAKVPPTAATLTPRNNRLVSNCVGGGQASTKPPTTTSAASSTAGGARSVVDHRTYGYGGTIISPTSGKKRVICQACGKTFCDKGALKIHYSAVHLREMHKCTIPGCNMRFSSRRSRNRHSANPNPKLHSPCRQRIIIDGEETDELGMALCDAIGTNGSINEAGEGNDSEAGGFDGQQDVDDTVSEGEEGFDGPGDLNNNNIGGEGMEDDCKSSTNNLQMDDGDGGESEKEEPTDFAKCLQSDSEASVSGQQSPFGSGDSAPNRRRKPSRPQHIFPPIGSESAPLSPISNGGGDGSISPSPLAESFDPNGGPIDRNPRQCPACFKYFQNPFSMRLHYQNVHLQLKHFCTVPGCQSVFPSKRSRDRHAANLKLHPQVPGGEATLIEKGEPLSDNEHFEQEDESGICLVTKRPKLAASSSSNDVQDEDDQLNHHLQTAVPLVAESITADSRCQASVGS